MPRSAGAMRAFVTVLVLMGSAIMPLAGTMGERGPSTINAVVPMANPAPWTDSLDDLSHVYVPTGGLVGIDVAGGEAHLKAGFDEGWIASSTITCPPGYRYDLVYLEVETPGASSIKVSVLNATMEPTEVGYANEPVPGFAKAHSTPDVSVITIVPTSYPELRIQVNLYGVGADRPRLLSWSLHYIGLEEWRDDFLGTGRMVDVRGINITGGRVEVNLTRKGGGGTVEYEPYPALAFVGGVADLTLFYPNAGRTSYNDATHFTAGGSKGAVAFDDVDADGNLDLIVGYDGTEDSRVHWGASDGTWSESGSSYATVNVDHVSHVDTGDINGDGYVDIAFAGSTDSWVLYGTGSRTIPSTPVALGQSHRRVDCGDVDADGYDDIVFSSTGSGSLFLGGPSGVSTAADRTYAIANCQDSYLGDLDRDGNLDILLGGKSGGKAQVYMGSPSGPDATADYQLTIPGGTLWAVAAGDINGDGYVDIATFDGTNPSNTCHFFEGAATGWSDSLMHTGFSAAISDAMMCLDVDKDGYDDIIIPSWSTSVEFLLFKGGTAWPTTAAVTKAGAHNYDVAAAIPRAGGGRYYKGTFTTEPISIGEGKKWDVLVLDGALPANTTASFTVLDASGEPIPGYEDMPGMDADLSGILVERIIQVRVTLTSEFNWTTPALDSILVKWMDKGAWREEFYGKAKIERLVNADVTGGRLGAHVIWWEHEGAADTLLFTTMRSDEGYDTKPGIYSAHTGFQSTSASFDVAGTSAAAASDVDKDGIIDVVFAVHRTSDTGYRAWSPLFMGHPTGFLPEPSFEFPTVGAMDVVVRDLNGDGYDDVVFAQEQDGTTYSVNSTLFWGRAGGWNATPDVEFETKGASDVVAADLDNDGRLDLAFACYKDESTSTDSMVFMQGTDGFDGASPTYRLPTNGARGVDSADLDNDDRLDLVFANSFLGGSVQIDSFVYWGRAGGGFEPTPGRLPTIGAEDVCVGGFDTDGWPDIAFANYRDNSNSYKVDSYVYSCDGTRVLPSTPSVRLPTIGAVAVTSVLFDPPGPEDLVFSCNYNGSSHGVPSMIFMGRPFPLYDSVSVPTVGATSCIVGGLMPKNRAAYLSKPIQPEDWTEAGGFHTFRYTAQLGAGVTGKLQLVDAATWAVLAETDLRAGGNEWTVDGLFSLRDHHSIRVLVTTAGVSLEDDLVLDNLWLNWTNRVHRAPTVVDLGMVQGNLLRLQQGELWVNVTDEYTMVKDLRVTVEHRLNGTATWATYLVTAPTFSNGSWRATVRPRADAPVGSYDFRVVVADSDMMSSGYREFPNALLVVNNLPSAPDIRIIPESPTTSSTLSVQIVTSATDIETTGLTYRYRWYRDGVLNATLTSDTVTAPFTERGQNWSVEVRAFDGLDVGAPAAAWVVIVNAPPQVKTPLPTPEIQEDAVDDQWIDLSKAFEDPDGDALTFSVNPVPDHIGVTIDQATGKVTLRPAQDWSGEEGITFWASDGTLSTSQTAFVTVTAVNDRPRFTTVNGQPITTDPVALSVDQGQQLTITIGSTDVEGDELVFSVNTTAVDVDEATGTITFQPGNDEVGTLRFALTMYDVASPSAKVTLNFTLTVVNKNDPMDAPRIVNPRSGDKFKVNVTFSLIGVCTDPDTQYGQSLSFKWYWNGTNYIGEGTSLTWNFTSPGTYNITLVVSDGEFSKEAHVVVTIEPKDIPTPPPPPPPPDGDDGGISTIMVIGILVVLVVVGAVMFLVLSRRREQRLEAEEVAKEQVDERQVALRRMAAAVKATADAMEMETGKAAVVPKAGGVQVGELEEVTIETRGPGGEVAVATAKGMEDRMLTMRPKETEAASKETEALFKDMSRVETAVSVADQDKMRVDNLKRKYATAIGRLPYGIPAPDLKSMDWNDLAALLATGQKRTLPDGHETTLVKGKWYYSDPADSSTFLKEHGAKPKSEPRRAAAPAPMDKTALLDKLEERFILGEITEESYMELKRKLEGDETAAPSHGEDWVEEE